MRIRSPSRLIRAPSALVNLIFSFVEMEKKMFYGASGGLFAKARVMRHNMTIAESLLWKRIKENRLGVRFKPQHPIDIFIVDFYCHEIKLVIEVDGKNHIFQKEKDNARSNELMINEIYIIRFKNEEIINNIDEVINKIKDCIWKLKK